LRNQQPHLENHRGIFESAGFEVLEYTYFDGKTRGVDFDGMVKSLESFQKYNCLVARLLPQPNRRRHY
jgi:aromatic-amino-acid transaminase